MGINAVVHMASNKASSTLFQVSLLQALALGDYDGSISLGELKKHGDIGIGTFDGLDGEMIMLDGIVYKASADGNVYRMKDEETTPFANVTFAKDDSFEFVSTDSMKDLDETLTGIVSKKGINCVHFVKIGGTFRSIRLRSVPKQSKPYRGLVDTLSTDQVEWTPKDIKGTIVGLYCPSYMGMINNHGWHLHFVSDDRNIGGHVLDVSMKNVLCKFTSVDKLELILPDRPSFHSLDLSVDQNKDIKKIEGSE